MIVNKNTNPERDLYYLGGQVIEILSDSSNNEFDYFELYKTVSQTQNIGINLYSLVLDWLYILGVIKKGNNGLIKKCF